MNSSACRNTHRDIEPMTEILTIQILLSLATILILILAWRNSVLAWRNSHLTVENGKLRTALRLALTHNATFVNNLTRDGL